MIFDKSGYNCQTRIQDHGYGTPKEDGIEMNGRVDGVTRPYAKEDVERLRGTVHVEHTLARLGAERLRELLGGDGLVRSLGALSGGQAVQMVKAGLQSIYVSGWQVAADANLAGQVYPDQSLYPADSARRSSAASTMRCCAPTRSTRPRATRRRDGSSRSSPTPSRLRRPAERVRADEGDGRDAAGVHDEDQLATEKQWGHLGGKVLVPTSQFIRTLIAARLAADVLDVRRSSSPAPTPTPRRC